MNTLLTIRTRSNGLLEESPPKRFTKLKKFTKRIIGFVSGFWFGNRLVDPRLKGESGRVDFKKLTRMQRLSLVRKMIVSPMTDRSNKIAIPVQAQRGLRFLAGGGSFDTVNFHLKHLVKEQQFEIAFGLEKDGISFPEALCCLLDQNGDFLWCARANTIEETFSFNKQIKVLHFRSEQLNVPDATSLTENQKSEKETIFRLDCLLQLAANLRDRKNFLN